MSVQVILVRRVVDAVLCLRDTRSAIPRSRSQRNTGGVFERREIAEALSRPGVEPTLERSDIHVREQPIVGLLGPDWARQSDRVLDTAFLP